MYTDLILWCGYLWLVKIFTKLIVWCGCLWLVRILPFYSEITKYFDEMESGTKEEEDEREEDRKGKDFSSKMTCHEV